MGVLFRGGVPTEPQVRQLMEAYPTPGIDELIPYEDVESLLGIQRDKPRFRTVTGAWRRKVRSLQNLAIEVVPGKGFIRLSEVSRSESDVGKWVRGKRYSGRAVRDMVRVDTTQIPELVRGQHDHRMRVMVANLEDDRRAAKEIAPPSPPRSLPRAVSE